MRHLLAVLSVILVLVQATPTAAQSARGCAPGQKPDYVFGFAELSTWLGDNMGAPTTCEYADPLGTGDTEQDTSAGLAFWRKSTNTPTFTNGWQHWALTARGRVTWTGTSVDPSPDAMLVVAEWTPPPASRTSGCVSTGSLPDAQCTPGALNPDVHQDTIGTTICVSGYTSRVRPPTSYTSPLERQLLVAYGRPGAPPVNFELDHLISLEIGGAPRDPANLWPEPYAGDLNARQKDVVENYLHQQVCNGAMTLNEAQRLIATDWVSVYHHIRP